jgi:hypothetical protein
LPLPLHSHLISPGEAGTHGTRRRPDVSAGRWPERPENCRAPWPQRYSQAQDASTRRARCDSGCSVESAAGPDRQGFLRGGGRESRSSSLPSLSGRPKVSERRPQLVLPLPAKNCGLGRTKTRRRIIKMQVGDGQRKIRMGGDVRFTDSVAHSGSRTV